jgi:hypothetical protein
MIFTRLEPIFGFPPGEARPAEKTEERQADIVHALLA